jgi:hypothetical protein
VLKSRKKRMAACALLSLFACCAAQIERKGIETRDFVEGVIPLSLQEVSSQIRDGVLGERFPAARSTVHLPGKLSSADNPDYREFSVFDSVPPDNILRENSRDDPAMERYLHLSSDARKNDISLINVGSEWFSEYTANSKPVPFTCGFIIHLQEDGPAQTRVEVLEYDPRVRFGKVFVVGHAEAGFVRDAKLVPPTTRDRVEMLVRIQTLTRVQR